VGGSDLETRLKGGVMVSAGMNIDSGLDGFWSGNDGGSGERRVRILENWRVYHSESDSASDSSEKSSRKEA